MYISTNINAAESLKQRTSETEVRENRQTTDTVLQKNLSNSDFKMISRFDRATYSRNMQTSRDYGRIVYIKR